MAKNNGLSGLDALMKLRESLPALDKVAEALPDANTRMSRAQYDEALAGEQSEQHNPNPFDFVFFDVSEKPSLYTVEEIEAGEKLYSGYLELTLKALTPVHIVGEQQAETLGHKISNSFFYKQATQYVIPGSSIKGMLRSFIEAITNGWVSQAQPPESYPKAYTKRHIGFSSFQETTNRHTVSLSSTSVVPPAIPHTYKAEINGKIDVASYLFGFVLDSGDVTARKGKIFIEDALVKEEQFGSYELPDIYKEGFGRDDSPFMGGAHPSISNWWYFLPLEAWERHPINPRGGRFHVAEFVGGRFWGRKFYYHQNPVACIDYYKSDAWRKDPKRPLYTYKCQCLDFNKSVKFRIQINRLPKNILDLLCVCLQSGDNVRQKLGYGKQYGFGSVQLNIDSIKVRNVSEPINIFDDSALQLKELPACSWAERSNITINGTSAVKESAVIEISRILGWEDIINNRQNNIVFSYPPNHRPFFQSAVLFPRFQSDTAGLRLSKDPSRGFATVITEKLAVQVARKLWNEKKPLHFLLYQARARFYKQRIIRRTP